MRALVLTLILSAPVSALACGMPASMRLDKALADVDALLEEPVKPVEKAPAQKVAPVQKATVAEVPVTPPVIAEATPQS